MRRNHISCTEVLIRYEVMILFSRLEKVKKNNKWISQRLKDFKKRSIRSQEIMKVNVLADINCC